jgi:hypothetical protein
MKAYLFSLATAFLFVASSAHAQSDASPEPTPAPTPTPAPPALAPPAPTSAPVPPPAAAPEVHTAPAPPETFPVLAPLPVRRPSSERPFTIDLDVLGYTVSASAAYPVSESYSSAVLGIRYVRPEYRIDIELPFAQFAGPTSSFGNIAFGAYYRHDYGALRFEIGAIVALPTAPVDSTVYTDGSVGVSALVTPGPSRLLAARGGDRAWLWIPHYFVPVAPSARLASADGRALSHATELTIAPMIATDAGVSDVLVPVIQLSEEVAAHASFFRAGARAEVVGAFANARSLGYFSIMPFVGIDGPSGFLDVGALFDLFNSPEPSSGNASPNWGLRMRGGFHF